MSALEARLQAPARLSPLLRGLVLMGLFAVLLLAAAAGAAERNLVVAATKAQPAHEPRIALVIGNADYPNAPLLNPLNDVRAVADRLAALRFQVTRLENANQEEMYEAIRAFGDQLRGGGVGVFYYAGHALQVRGRNYLLPARARIEREDEIIYRTVDTGQILDKMESARNRVNIVILDACRNNPFGREFRNVSPGLAVVDAPYNTLIAFATAPGAVASDGGGPNGLYTQHLLQSMSDPGLRLEDVFKKVRSGVRRDSAGRQVPWESTSLEVDFYFDPTPAQVAAAAPPPVPAPAPPDALTLELAFWDSVKGSSDPEDFRAYLLRYPQGLFAVLASNRLRTLSPPTAPAAAPTAQMGAPPVSSPVAPPAAPPIVTSSPATAMPMPAAPPGPGSVSVAATGATVVAVVPALVQPAVPPAAMASAGSTPALQPARVLRGHAVPVAALAVSRNGGQALSGAGDGSLRLWDVASGRELRRFATGAAVTAAAMAPVGAAVLSGGADRSVRLWDTASGAEGAHMQGHSAPVSALVFGPTARYAVSAAENGELILWDLPGGRLIRRAQAGEARVHGVALSADGRLLLSASADGVVRQWDVGTLTVVRTFGPLAGPVLAAAFAPATQQVHAVDGRGELWAWQSNGAVLVRRLATGSRLPLHAALSGDGANALIAGADGELTLWDIASGRAAWRASSRGGRVTALAVGPRGAFVLSAFDDMRLLLWALEP